MVAVIGEALGCDVESSDDEYLFGGGQLSSLLPVKKAAIEELVDTVGKYEELNPACVVTETSYEVMVRTESRSLMTSRLFEDGVSLEDPQSETSYELGPASPAFMVHLILRMRDQVGPRWRRNVRAPLSWRDRQRRESVDGLAAFRSVIRVRTLRLTSAARRSPAWWKPYADAFFFHIGFNLDVPVMPLAGIDHLLEPSKIRGMRRSSMDDLDPPRRHYVMDLVHHYQLGVSADSAMLKYLSYYHVAEHWFENIFQDDLVEKIQGFLTSPDFSYRRKQDVRSLIKRVSKEIQVKDDGVVISEQAALRLTLERYVDLPRLLNDLNSFDRTLHATYANRVVSFSGGDTFDLMNRNRSEVIAAMGRRIYKTRNSLVHSKEGAKGRFIPFAHDAELSTEVPLMRFVAEQIIVATSKMAPAGGGHG
ncbi:hypothetical protein [Micromonospora sp. WMMC273]|uniref:hypothetical protein n=1 Tax=Micromonospora sp. WMMC273 TaxID=3015157 RepID=UPI0022B5F070|nr:hypothetical protein [Micromonospora sp. WMMC273]MCZ7474659.1 hypothetical protein [Micromonospora sp. WMMC273]